MASKERFHLAYESMKFMETIGPMKSLGPVDAVKSIDIQDSLEGNAWDEWLPLSPRMPKSPQVITGWRGIH